MFREPFPDNPIYLASQIQKNLITRLSNSRVFADEFDRIREKVKDPKLTSDEAKEIIDWLIEEGSTRKAERAKLANELQMILFRYREIIPAKKLKNWREIAEETQTTVNRLKQTTTIVRDFVSALQEKR